MILAIDPSLTSTGYALIDENKKVLHCGTIKTSSDQVDVERFRVIATKIKELVELYNPDVFAIETQYINFGIRSNSALRVAEVKGVITGVVLVAATVEKYFAVNPKTVKSFIGLESKVKRKEAKEASLAFVKALYPYLKVKSDDVSDAILIGLYVHEALYALS